MHYQHVHVRQPINSNETAHVMMLVKLSYMKYKLKRLSKTKLYKPDIVVFKEPRHRTEEGNKACSTENSKRGTCAL